MSLKPLEVKTANIATKAVTSDKIADNAIEARHIKEGTVTPDKLTITPVARPMTPGLETGEIKDGAVTSIKIAPNAVTTDHIAANAVATDDIKDNAITTEKIRDGAITREKVADRSVGTADLVDGAVTNAKIAANTITGAKIAANAVGASEIAPNAVGYSEIASQSLEPRSIKTLSGLPPAPGQVPVYDESQGNLWWFKWVTPGAAARPLTPPITTDEIGDGQVTPSKLSFTPAQIRVGFYDGDGNPSQVISVPGLNPQGVIIYPQASGLDGPYFRVGGDSWTQTISWAALGLVYGGDLILLGADGFTVAGGTNTNGVRFSYIALG